MKNPFKQWFEVFKSGKHTDSKGNEREWTETELQTIAEKYNEQSEHEAPIVVGHPKDNSPAYGWIAKLKAEGGKLFAMAKDEIVPEFVEAVKKGMYKKRSISLYPDLTLRHIGFLGAVPPAVKGLKDLAFAEDESLVFEFGEDEPANQEPPANEPNPNEEIDKLKAELELKNAEIEKLKAYEEDNTKLKEQIQFVEDEKQKAMSILKDLELKSRITNIQMYLQEQVAYGNISPAQSEKFLMVFQALDSIELVEKDNAQVFEFAEFDDKGNKTLKYANPVDVLKEVISSIKKQSAPITNYQEIEGESKDTLAAARKYMIDFNEKNPGREIKLAKAIDLVKSGKVKN